MAPANKVQIAVNATDGNSRRVIASIKDAFGRLKVEVKSSMESATSAIKDADRATEKLGRDSRDTGSKVSASSRQIGGSSSHVSRLGSAMEGAKGKALALASAIKTAAIGIATAVAAAAVAVAGFGIKAAADNQVAAISFEVLLGSAKKAKDFLDKLKAFAAATPFDLPTLKDAASRLLAVGVATKDVIPLMTRLGDATAGMGTGADGINRAVYALQQMRQAGKVSLEDINQLTDAGIPALDALAAHFKTTVSEIRKRITAGKITADDLFGAIQRGEGPAFQRLKGMMDKQSATLTGVWSTFKDNTQQALADAFQPAIPALTNVVNMVGQGIPKAIDKLKGYWSKLSGIFKGSGLLEFIDRVKKKFSDEFATNLKHSVDGLINNIKAHKDEIKQIIEMIVTFVGQIIAWAPKVIGVFSAIVSIASAVIDAVNWIARKVVNFFAGVAQAAANAFGWIPGLGPQLNKAAENSRIFAAQVNAALDSIHDKTINIKYSVDPGKGKSGTSGGKSGGGNKSVKGAYASGGDTPSTDWFWTGEDGPELMNRRTGRVMPHSRSMAAVADAAGSGGRSAGTARVVHWGPGIDSAFASFFMRLVNNGQIKIA